jgi:hypothetical protein
MPHNQGFLAATITKKRRVFLDIEENVAQKFGVLHGRPRLLLFV